MLREWIPSIIESIKKDLKNDHLKQDRQFAKKYLNGKNPGKMTTEDLVEAYSQALEEGENAEALAEFISNRWLLKNGELYGYFESKLSEISPNFVELEEIDYAKSKEIVTGSVGQYGPLRTYLFSIINSVVFPEKIYKELGLLAKQHEEKASEELKMREEQYSIESMKQAYEQQISRLTDKYEKKLNGLQKKYTTDVESLKKQLGNLQRKFDGR